MSDWQPIESAPRDGTRILLAHKRLVIDAGRYWRNENRKHPRERWIWNGWPNFEPTHWMPLPSPPA